MVTAKGPPSCSPVSFCHAVCVCVCVCVVQSACCDTFHEKQMWVSRRGSSDFFGWGERNERVVGVACSCFIALRVLARPALFHTHLHHFDLVCLLYVLRCVPANDRADINNNKQRQRRRRRRRGQEARAFGRTSGACDHGGARAAATAAATTVGFVFCAVW